MIGCWIAALLSLVTFFLALQKESDPPPGGSRRAASPGQKPSHQTRKTYRVTRRVDSLGTNAGAGKLTTGTSPFSKASMATAACAPVS